MSRSKQRKGHTGRAKAPTREKVARVVRVRLVNGLYVCLTALILLASLAAMLVMQGLGWFDTVPGAVLSVLVGGLGVMCLFDMALLLTACITVADGAVNAGKNAQGDLMCFHTEHIARVELRDRTGRPVTENQKRYRQVSLSFVMDSGRVNQRPIGRITQRQLNRVRAAVGKPKR